MTQKVLHIKKDIESFVAACIVALNSRDVIDQCVILMHSDKYITKDHYLMKSSDCEKKLHMFVNTIPEEDLTSSITTCGDQYGVFSNTTSVKTVKPFDQASVVMLTNYDIIDMALAQGSIASEEAYFRYIENKEEFSELYEQKQYRAAALTLLGI